MCWGHGYIHRNNATADRKIESDDTKFVGFSVIFFFTLLFRCVCFFFLVRLCVDRGGQRYEMAWMPKEIERGENQKRLLGRSCKRLRTGKSFFAGSKRDIEDQGIIRVLINRFSIAGGGLLCALENNAYFYHFSPCVFRVRAERIFRIVCNHMAD